MRVAEHWNREPREMVKPSSLESLQNPLDAILGNLLGVTLLWMISRDAFSKPYPCAILQGAPTPEDQSRQLQQSEAHSAAGCSFLGTVTPLQHHWQNRTSLGMSTQRALFRAPGSSARSPPLVV